MYETEIQGKGDIILKSEITYYVLVYVTAFLLISIASWQFWLGHIGSKTPLPNVEKELMTEAQRLLKKEEEGSFLPSPLFL